MAHHTKVLNVGESTGTQPVDTDRNPNIIVKNTSTENLAAFEITRDHSVTPETMPLGKGGQLELYAEMMFNVECVSGQIRVEWDD